MFACQNLGRGSFVAAQMLPFMQRATDAHPAWVSLCAGANDVTSRHYDQSETVADVLQMIQIAHAGGVRVALTLIPQRRMHLDEIDALNSALREMPADVVIDLSITLAPEGVLLEQYTTDGVHLSSEAYRVWAQQLRSALRQSDEPRLPGGPEFALTPEPPA
jgi:lysophospholipase L1-like esterase